MGDAKEKLRDDVRRIEDAEALGKVEAFILGLKAREDAEEAVREKRRDGAGSPEGAS